MTPLTAAFPELLFVFAVIEKWGCGDSGWSCFPALPAGRDKSDKPLKEMTKEELLNRFDGAEAMYGTYSIATGEGAPTTIGTVRIFYTFCQCPKRPKRYLPIHAGQSKLTRFRR